MITNIINQELVDYLYFGTEEIFIDVFNHKNIISANTNDARSLTIPKERLTEFGGIPFSYINKQGMQRYCPFTGMPTHIRQK